jgi:hypothetical protein
LGFSLHPHPAIFPAYARRAQRPACSKRQAQLEPSAARCTNRAMTFLSALLDIEVSASYERETVVESEVVHRLAAYAVTIEVW